jgi:membrane protein
MARPLYPKPPRRKHLACAVAAAGGDAGSRPALGLPGCRAAAHGGTRRGYSFCMTRSRQSDDRRDSPRRARDVPGLAWGLARDSVAKFLDDSPFEMAAALSFYTMLSLSPLLLIVVSAAGLVWGEDSVRAQILTQMRELIGTAGAGAVRTVLDRSAFTGHTVTSMVIGVLTLIFGATTVFVELQSALNRIWKVETSPQATTRPALLWSLVRTRLLALALIFVVGFLLLVSLVVSAGLAALHDYLARSFERGAIVWEVVNFLVSLAVIALLIAMVYRVLPDVRLAWGDVWGGALVTAALFSIGKFLIGLYLGQTSVASAYGAAGSLVVLLLWVYYSSLIMFLGAEITAVHARHRHRVRPAEFAVRVPAKAG